MPVPAPSAGQLQRLVQRIAERVGRLLERSGLITRDIENADLALDPSEEPPIHGLLGASITYRIATGPREGQDVAPGILPSALRASLRLSKIAPGDFVEPEEFMAHRDVPDETCLQCGGRLRVIASIEQAAVIDRILEHLGRDAGSVDPAHPSRATQAGSVDLTAAAAPAAPGPPRLDGRVWP